MTFFEEIVEAFRIFKEERENAPDSVKKFLFNSVDLGGSNLKVFDARVSNGRLEVYAIPFNRSRNSAQQNKRWLAVNGQKAETLCEEVYEMLEQNREMIEND